MKIPSASPLVMAMCLSVLALGTHAAESKPATQKKALSAKDVNNISERIRQTGDEVRADLKKARARFEAQEAARKVAAERARQLAIQENARRQAEKAALARERQLAAQAQAERARQEAEQLKQQAERAERKKQLLIAAQESKEAQAASLQARKAKAAEALRKARASSGAKAFGE